MHIPDSRFNSIRLLPNFIEKFSEILSRERLRWIKINIEIVFSVGLVFNDI
jgi:hypothetical protein